MQLFGMMKDVHIKSLCVWSLFFFHFGDVAES